MTEALTLSVCENVQCQHRPCQRPNILKVLKVFRRCASQSENSGIPHWWTGGRLVRCGGERKAEHLSEKTHLRALQHWISHQCNELKEAFHSLAAGIAAKYVCYMLMSVATMRVI